MIRLIALCLLVLSAGQHAMASNLVTLAPLAECQWIFLGRVDNPNAICPSLETRQGSRSALLFDLSGIYPGAIASITLELATVEGASGGFWIEAIGKADQAAADPFITTRVNPEARSGSNPCFVSPADCPAMRVNNPDDTTGGYGLPFFNDERRQAVNVDEAVLALSQGDQFLQLSLIPNDCALNVQSCGGRFWHSGFGSSRTSLIVEIVPEPASAALVLLGLAMIASRDKGHTFARNPDRIMARRPRAT